jgi:hypothetical protein
VAENSFTLDAATERPRVERRSCARASAAARRARSPPRSRSSLDAKIDEEMTRDAAALKGEQVPALMAEQERWIAWMEAATAALLVVALDPKSFDVSLRVTAPLPSH